MNPDADGWSKAEMHVMAELDRLSLEVHDMRETLGGMHKILGEVRGDLTALKVGDKRHAIIFGLVGGGVIAFVFNVFAWGVLR